MEPAPTITPQLDVLLLSNSRNHQMMLLEHARDEIARVAAGRRVVFLPYALADWDGYTEAVEHALPGVEICGAHRLAYSDEAILAAYCVFAGGGNTFRLLATLERLDLIGPLGERVRAGDCAFIGSSAGTNIAGPSIRTTNDMPILATASLPALGLVPFQINAHFIEDVIPGLVVETRVERLAQFHEHSSAPVVALFEGSWLRVTGGEAAVAGPPAGAVAAKVFEPGSVRDLHAGESVAPWWRPARFDDRAGMGALINRHHRVLAGPKSR